MKQKFFFIMFMSLSLMTYAQQTQTKQFSVSGKIKTELQIDQTTLLKHTAISIGDVVITNHLGEKKSTAKNLKGVLIRDVLKTVEPDCENPRQFSEFYFVFKATDGYTVVFSWNELFNSTVGNQAYFITEKDGKSIHALDESIAILVPTDERTGRRYLKNLTAITVGRAQ